MAGMNKCQKCGSDKLYPIAGRKSLACPKGHHTSPIANTPMRKSRTDQSEWEWVFKVLRKNQRISAKEIQRLTGVTYKTAWRMKKLIITNLALFDQHFISLAEDWDEKPDWMLQREKLALEQLEQSLTAGVEFNYRKSAEQIFDKLSRKYAGKPM